MNEIENEINIVKWDGAEKPVGILQIAHGMSEHIGRYDAFAKYMSSHGFIVAGEDHIAHGHTAGLQNLGRVPDGKDCFPDTVENMIALTHRLKEEYPGLPVILFGHSYGSFLAQSYIEKASCDIAGVILAGTAGMNTASAKLGIIVSEIGTAFKGKDKYAKLIKKLTFDAYNKAFKEKGNKTENLWLSRNRDFVDDYNADPMCGHPMSYGFYKSFFKGLKNIYKTESLTSVRKDLPIFIIAGDKDPVGDFGRLVHKLYDLYNQVAIKSVEMKLYPEARHDILNELNHEEVYEDIKTFIFNII